jgi:plasmid stabilization system protein ParE
MMWDHAAAQELLDALFAKAAELLAFPSVARGHYSLCSDATMGRRLDVSDSTARR